MLFNSYEFILFFPVVFFLYWILNKKNLIFQNALLLFSSYFFYACWDYRFLLLLLLSTFIDYFCGLKISQSISKSKKKNWFRISLITNLSLLCVFKYFNFFIESGVKSLNLIGLHPHFQSLQIILPIGISFYTFHGISYVIDIYNNKIQAEKDIIVYSLFVSFFPLLVAGPIERADHLLPQFKKRREFNYNVATEGLRQILWGFFKKIVIADSCAVFADNAFEHYSTYSGSTLFLGVIFFALQVYGDFSGYSDIALGISKLLGIRLKNNFLSPYFSRSISEFWRRWHISLMTWFRDYLYIPLGGNQTGRIIQYRNLIIVFFLAGLWHGGKWNYIIWGLINAIFIIITDLLIGPLVETNIVAQNKFLPSLKELLEMLTTFVMVLVGYSIFRSNDTQAAIVFLSKVFSTSLFSPTNFSSNFYNPGFTIILFIFIVIEWIGRSGSFAIQEIPKKIPKFFQYLFYYSVLFTICFYIGSKKQFYYFQF